MQRYLIFAVGLLVLVIVFAPSLGMLTDNVQGSADSAVSGDQVGPPIVGPPIVAPPGNAGAAGAIGGDGLTATRDAGGQFHIDAVANGHAVRFLVDTGADGLALTETDARAAGLTLDPDAYRQVANTASGPGYGAHVRIDQLDIGGQTLRDVDAVALRGLGTSLLGQSVLRRLGPVSINGDRMTIGAAK